MRNKTDIYIELIQSLYLQNHFAENIDECQTFEMTFGTELRLL